MRPLLLLPEILLFVGGLSALTGGSFLARERQWVTRAVAVAALIGSIVAAAVTMAGSAQPAFEGAFAVDAATGVARLVAASATLLILALAVGEIAGSARESETYALLLWSTCGTLLLAGATDLLVLVVGFLLSSIPLYALVGLVRTPAGAEATMKTYLMGSLFGILLMLGVTILYGGAGNTAYVDLPGLAGAPSAAVAAGGAAVLVGLMFKAGGVPAHFWVPDAAQAAGGTVATFLTTVPKIGALVAAYRLVNALPDTVDWAVLVGALAVAGMAIGNLAAYWQTDPRRLLGWSTVGQVGFLLVPVAAAGQSDLALPALLFYLAGYTVTNVAAFAVTAALPDRRELTAYRGLFRVRPLLAGALVVALLGLVGTPPTAVFVGKVTTATAAWDGGLPWLAVAVFVATLLSLFYYLRWIIPVCQTADTAEDDGPDVTPVPWAARTAVATAALALVLGLLAGPVWGALDQPLLG